MPDLSREDQAIQDAINAQSNVAEANQIKLLIQLKEDEIAALRSRLDGFEKTEVEEEPEEVEEEEVSAPDESLEEGKGDEVPVVEAPVEEPPVVEVAPKAKGKTK